MPTTKHYAAAIATAVLTSTITLAAPPATAHTTGIHDNCTNLNQKWAHGVGRRRAVDQTTGERVTNFYRKTRAYKRAMNHNSTLDRDKDGIACEKH